MHGIFFNDFDASHIGHIVCECYKDRIYDPFLKPGMDTILEVGGNVGAVTLYLARFCRRLLVMEPSPRHLKVLRHTVGYNGLENVQVIPCALWECGGFRMLHENPENSTMDSICWGGSGKAMPVECMSLSRVLDEFNVENVDFMKLDVEGAEESIVRSESFQREAHRVRAMVAECHGLLRPFLDALEGAGFQCERLESHPTIVAAKRNK